MHGINRAERSGDKRKKKAFSKTNLYKVVLGKLQ